LLIEAKAKLKHGEFEKMIEQLLPFKPRMAQMLMKIAADKRLIKAKHASLLPPSWYTLYRLTTLSDADFQAALDDGTINPEMTRDDIPERVVVYNVKKSETPPTTIVPVYVDASNESVPARVIVPHYVEAPQNRIADDRADRLIDALELLAELADPALADKLVEMLRELDPDRLFRVREAIHAISQIEAALKSRLS
jgi:hypothetical protein